jgi:hypothetical protein
MTWRYGNFDRPAVTSSVRPSAKSVEVCVVAGCAEMENGDAEGCGGAGHVGVVRWGGEPR